MDTWAKDTFHRPIEKIILDKLKRGGKLTILFLDPRMQIIAQLVSEEGQTSTMLQDLRTSLGICARLAVHLQNRAGSNDHSNGSLKIAVYKKNSTFAYHKQGNQMLIGFYPLNSKGEKSPVYEAIGEGIWGPFDEHFATLIADHETTKLIDYKEGRVKNHIDTATIDELLECLP
jgi:hypothetical protein